MRSTIKALVTYTILQRDVCLKKMDVYLKKINRKSNSVVYIENIDMNPYKLSSNTLETSKVIPYCNLTSNELDFLRKRQ